MIVLRLFQPAVGPFPVGSGGQEEEWVKMLMVSPLFQQINDLQLLLDKNSVTGATGTVLGESLGAIFRNIWETTKRFFSCSM